MSRARSSLALAAVLLAGACSVAPRARHLVIAIGSAPLTLDPRGAFNADTAHVQQLLFDALVTKGPDFDFAPGLAVSWDSSPDATRTTFRLRSDVRFHDGRTLTANDVAYTFNSLVGGGLGKSSAFAALERVEVVDALDVRFVSNRPNPGLLVDLVAVGVLPDGGGETATHAPVGTGPFRLTAPYAGDGDLQLAAFESYFGGPPQFDGVEVRVIPDASTRALALEAGDVDLVLNPGFAPEVVSGLAASAIGLRVVTASGGGVQFVVLNTERPELADERVRRALALAVDRTAAASALLGGRARLAATPLPPGHWAAADLPQTPFDPSAARRLLAETPTAGPRTLELLTLPSSADRDLGAALRAMWGAVGVETTVVPVESAVFAERLARGDFQAALHRFTGGNQFTTIFKGAFHSRSIHDSTGAHGELNYARYADAELDALVDRADRSVDRDERRRLYADIQDRLAAKTPWILLWYPDNVAVAGPRVGDFALDRSGDFTFVRSLTLSPRT